MTDTISWLLSKNDWIAYNTKLDLLEESEKTHESTNLKRIILSQPHFNALISDLKSWPGYTLKRHNDSNHLIHKLSFLADAGIKITDPGIMNIIEKIKAYVSDDGIYTVLSNIPTNFGGSGEDEMVWMLCDAPSILYSFAQMGMSRDGDVLNASRYLIDLQDENGWRCKASGSLKKFSGPGKKTDPCPYANLLMLKLIAALKTDEFNKQVTIGLEAILALWKNQKNRKEHMFGIGTDFRKPKAPLIWFDMLHVLNVLSNYEQIFDDENFMQMLDELEGMLGESNKITPLSMYRPWKEWEFSNKKEPSRWLTFLALRVLKRTGRI